MKSVHTCRYICELTPRWSKQYICNCRRSSFQTSHPYTSNFPGSQTGQSLIALLDVASLSQLTPQRYAFFLKVDSLWAEILHLGSKISRNMTFLQVLFCPFSASSCIIAELWLSSQYETWFIKTGSGTHRRSSADIGKWIWAVESPLIISHAREAFTHHTKTALGISEEWRGGNTAAYAGCAIAVCWLWLLRGLLCPLRTFGGAALPLANTMLDWHLTMTPYSTWSILYV